MIFFWTQYTYLFIYFLHIDLDTPRWKADLLQLVMIIPLTIPDIQAQN